MEQVLQIQPVTAPSDLSLYLIDREDTSDINKTEKIHALFLKGSEHFTPCGFTELYYDSHQPCQVHAIPHSCDSWQCCNCGCRLKMKWYITFVCHMSKEAYLEVLEVADAKWDAFRKRLNRANDKTEGRPYRYGRFLRKADRSIIRIITNLESGGTAVPLDLLDSLLVSSIAETPFVKKPIYASRAWLPKAKELADKRAKDRKTKTELVKIGPSKLTPTEIGQIAHTFGIDHLASGYDGFSRTIYLPAKWMDPMAFSSLLIHLGVRLPEGKPDIDLAGMDREIRAERSSDAVPEM